MRSPNNICIETDAKEKKWLKISPFVRNPQVLLPNHELVILIMFCTDLQEIVNFLVKTKL